MEYPREIWDDIEEAREKLRTKRRQVTGGDIEDEVVLKGKSVILLADETFEIMEDSIDAILFGIQDGLYEKKEGQDQGGIAEDLKEFISTVREKRRSINHSMLEERIEDIWEDLEDRFRSILRRKDD